MWRHSANDLDSFILHHKPPVWQADGVEGMNHQMAPLPRQTCTLHSSVIWHPSSVVFLCWTSLAFATGTTSKHQRVTWPGLYRYRKLIEFLLCHMSIRSLARGHMVGVCIICLFHSASFLMWRFRSRRFNLFRVNRISTIPSVVNYSGPEVHICLYVRGLY